MATNYVLRLTPIGMDMDEVIRIVRNHRNWDIAWTSHESGFSHPQLRYITDVRNEGLHIIGDKSIRVDAGRFWPADIPIMGLFMETMASIFWGFDEDGKLIEVYVWRSFR